MTITDEQRIILFQASDMLKRADKAIHKPVMDAMDAIGELLDAYNKAKKDEVASWNEEAPEVIKLMNRLVYGNNNDSMDDLLGGIHDLNLSFRYLADFEKERNEDQS